MKLISTQNPRSFKWIAFLFHVLLITLTFSKSYSQTKIYATTANVKSNIVDNATDATNGTNSFSTIKSYGGLALNIGKFSGELELVFPSQLPANKTTFVRIDFDADVLNTLLGGNLGGLLANVLGNVVLGNHYFEIGARNSTVTRVSGTSSGAFTSPNLRLIKDAAGNFYIAITPTAPYDRVYIKDVTDAALLGATNEMKVYNAFYIDGIDPCTNAFATNYDGTGLTLDVLGLGKAGVTNAQHAVDNDPSTFSEISLGALGVAGSISQNIYFSSHSKPGDEFSVRLLVNPALISAGVLNQIRITAYNGNTEVFNAPLNSLITLDLLGLLNSGQIVNIPFKSNLSFNSVRITLNSLLNVGLTQTVNLYSVVSSAPRPTFTAPFSNTINVCYNTSASLNATTTADTELVWYDVQIGGAALATTAYNSAYTTDLLTANKTYYVAAKRIGCSSESIRVPVNVVVNPAITFNTTALSNANVGSAYSKQINVATGGTAPYTYTGSNLPAGIVLSSTGQIGGTPTLAGDYTFNIVTKDAKNCTVTTSFTLKVTAKLALPTKSLPNGTVGTTYVTQEIPLVTGGTSPYTYTATGLPAGLNFNPTTREITGTPTAAGSFTFPVTVVDTDGNSIATNYTIIVKEALVLVASPLADGIVGTTYPTQTLLAASGGTGPYTYAVTGLPTGLTFNPETREITGTPTVAGTFTIPLTVTDSEGRVATANHSINIINPLALPTKTLADGTVAVAYPTEVLPAAIGGTSPYTYSVSALPPGLSFNATTREITGTPTQAGNYTITLTATDAGLRNVSRPYTLKVNGALSLPTADLADGTVGTLYPSQTLPSVSGGSGNYTYVATNLPPGLNFNTTTRAITGTPTQGGIYTISLTATDTDGNKVNTDYTINVNVAAPIIANATICSGNTTMLAVTNVIAGVTYNWYGATGNTPLATGNTGSFTIPAINNTTTFYVEAVSGTAVSNRTAVIVNVNPAPNAPTITTPNQNVNAGQSTVLQASVNAGEVVNWYSSAVGGAILSTGPSFTTPTLANTTIFYAEAVNTNGCSSTTRTAVTVTVVSGAGNPNCNAAKTQDTGINGICLLCNISGPGNSTDADLNNFTRISLAVGVAATGYQRLIFAGSGAATDSIKLDLATPTGLLDLGVLSGITVNVMNGNTVVRTYQLNSALIDLKLLAGNRFKATVLAGAVYDRVEVRFGATVAALTSLDIYGAEVIYPKPTLVAGDQTICSGNTATLNATPNGGTTIAWYSAAVGGTLLASGNTYTTPALTTTTTYFIEVSKAGCANAERVPVKVTVTPILAVPVLAAAPSSCQGSTTVLSVASPDPAITYKWYDVSVGGTSIFTGPTFTTPILTANKIYYVEASQGNCTSATRAMVNVTVNPLPAAPQVQSSASIITPGQTVVLTATSLEPNVDFKWYSSANSTSPLATGSTFVTPPLSTTTSYFVESSSTTSGCSSATRIQVTITVDGSGPLNPVPCEAAISQTNGVTGIALLAGVSNANLAIDDNTQTGSTLLMPVGVLASVYQRLSFGSLSNSGDTVKILINSPSKLLSASVLGSLELSTLNAGVSNNDVIASNNALITLELLSGNTQALLTFVPTAQFDAVEVRLNSGLVGALTSINVNYAQRLVSKPTVAAANVTACVSQTATLTVTSPKAGVIYKWYDEAGVYQVGKDGVSFITPSLTANTKYFVEATTTSGCASARTVVNITTTPLAAAPELISPTVSTCVGSGIILQIKNPDPNYTYKWYNAANTYLVGQDGTTLTIPAIAANTTYSVEAINSCGLPSATRTTATVNVGAVDVPIITPAAVTVTSGSPAVLTATSSAPGATFNWYDSADPNAIIFTGSTFITGALTTDKTYEVALVLVGPCQAAARASVTVTVIGNGTPETAPCGYASVLGDDGLGGIALLGGVANKELAVDDKIETSSSLYIPVGLLGGYVYQRVGFAGGLSNIGDTLTVRLSSPGKLLSLAVLPSLTLTTYNGAVSNGDDMVVNNPLISLELLSDNSSIILKYVPTAKFDGVEVRLSSGLVGALTSINFNYAARTTVAPQVVANNASACQGSSATLSVRNPVAGVTYKWYLEGTYQAGSDGVTFITPTTLVAGNYNYFVKAFSNGCESVGTKVVVTILPPPTAPVPSTGNPTTACANTATTLSVQPVNGISYNWYDINGNLLVLNNNTYTTPANLAAGTYDYFVKAINGNSCANLTDTKISIVVNPSSVASDIQVSGNMVVCDAVGTTLVASSTTVNDPVFTWYSDATLTTQVFVGSSFTTPNLTSTTSYYVTVNGSNKCANNPADAKVVTVTINPSAMADDINLAGQTTICSGSTVTLTANSTTVINPIFTWYRNAALTDVAFQGSSFTTLALSSNTTYYVTVKGDNKCENKSADAKVITIIVNPLSSAADVTVTGISSICSGSVTLLSASSTTVTNPVFTWYRNSDLTDVAFVGSAFTTPVLTGTTTYYVTVKGDNKCENDVANVKVVVVSIKDYATAADINLDNATICAGSNATLRASSFTVTNPIFTWYSDASLTVPVFVGPTFITPALTANETYYVTVKGDNKCENKAIDAKVVIVNVNSLSSTTDLIVTGNTTGCVGSPIVLTATSPTVANPIFTWYADATLKSIVYIGAVFTSQPLFVTTTYYVTVKGDNQCENSSGNAKVIVITVKPVATSADITANNATICEGEAATLVASTTTVTNPVFTWYRDAALTDVAFTGLSFTTPTLTTTTTYFVTVKGDNVCENSSSTAKIVTVTVNGKATAADITVNTPATICGTAAVTLTASSLTVTNPVFTWYSNAALTTVAHSGATFVTPSLSTTTTYYVTVKGDNRCENAASAARLITVEVKPIAIATDVEIAGNTTICEGLTTTISANSTTVTNPIFTWYKDAALTDVAFVGSSFVTPALTSTTTYYVTVKGDNKCENSSATARTVVVTVNARPNNPLIATTGRNICSGDATTLIVENVSPGITYEWYTAATGGTLVFTGDNFTTPIINATTDYYVQALGSNGCGNASGRVRVTVTVTARPSAPVVAANNVNVCIGATGTLTVSNPVSGTTYTWFTTAIGGVAVGTGSSFITPSILVNSVYYVEAANGSCTATSRTAVNVIALQVPIVPSSLSAANGTICSGSTTLLSVNNPDASLNYRWYSSSSGGTMLAEGITYTPTALNATTIFYVESVSKSGGCASNTRTSITVNVLPVLTAPVVSMQSATPNSIVFAWNAVTGALAYEVSIDGGITWISPSSGATGTTHIVNNLKPDESVTILVRAKGQIDCQTSANSTPFKGTSTNPFANDLFVPNTFTPNGDGNNDIFFAYGNSVAKFKMRIYNQWGEFLFESQSINTGWDGRYKGTIQPNGVYVYSIEVTFNDGTTKTKNGTVTLLR